MTSTMRKGLAVAALHVAIVASLGAKLLADRATRPRVWARTAPFDPNLPIRGRYVRLRVMAIPGPGANEAQRPWNLSWFALSADGSRLVATPLPGRSGVIGTVVDRAGERIVELAEPLAYFIPEHVPDPSRRPAGEELWVEVTVPRAGAPRPIRLGVKKDGVLTPLND
jgi:hypothetical protein